MSFLFCLSRTAWSRPDSRSAFTRFLLQERADARLREQMGLLERATKQEKEQESLVAELKREVRV
jgi:hypothetical protein